MRCIAVLYSKPFENFIAPYTTEYRYNIQKGKSASYRLIYLLELATSILLLTIYRKAEKEDVTVNDINSILGEYFGEE